MTAVWMAFSLSAEAVDFIVPSGNISPACLQSVPTAASPFLLSKIKMAHLLPERKSVMNNKIEVFKNEQFGEIRTALIENEPWFVAVSYTHLDVYKRQLRMFAGLLSENLAT